jgi:serine-type D-Ala-D-Ala carboxypeptidase (penicillin-binding protein 5/6)
MMRVFQIGFAIFCIFRLHAAQFPLSVRAEAAVLINAETGAILFDKNAREVRYPASITKIATAWYILEKYGHRLEEKTIASQKALTYCPVHLKRNYPEKYSSHYLEQGATLMHLIPNEEVSIRSLLYGLMLVSGNDAANVLVEHFGGSNESFMAALNQFLWEKGFKNTKFSNPHGLHHKEHMTTALEMAQIASKAFCNGLFREIVSAQSYEKPSSNMQPAMTLRQQNRLITPGRYHYPKAFGGKTGHTARAGFTLVAGARQGERSLVAVLLGCKEADDRYRDAKVLFEAAFNEKKVARTLLTAEHDRFPLKIKGAKQTLQAKMVNDLKIEYFPSEEPKLVSAIEWASLQLPIKEGQIVGQLVLYNGQNQKVAYQPLAAISQVDPTFWKRWNLFFNRLHVPKRTASIIMMFMGVSMSAFGVALVLKKRTNNDKVQ